MNEDINLIYTSVDPEETIEIFQTPIDPCITFCPDSSSEKWIMKIEKTEEGASIRFNTEVYPNYPADAFAKAVCEILCTVGYLDRIYKQHYEKINKEKENE